MNDENDYEYKEGRGMRTPTKKELYQMIERLIPFIERGIMKGAYRPLLIKESLQVFNDAQDILENS